MKSFVKNDPARRLTINSRPKVATMHSIQSPMRSLFLILFLILSFWGQAAIIPIVNEPTKEAAVDSYVAVLTQRHPLSDSIVIFLNPDHGFQAVFEVTFPAESDTLSHYYQLGLFYADTSESWIGQEAWVGTAFEYVAQIQLPKDVFGSLYHEAQRGETNILRKLIPAEGFEISQISASREEEEPSEQDIVIAADTITYKDLGFDYFSPSVFQMDIFIETQYNDSGLGKISVYGGGFSEILWVMKTEGQVFLLKRQASDH